MRNAQRATHNAQRKTHTRIHTQSGTQHTMHIHTQMGRATHNTQHTTHIHSSTPKVGRATRTIRNTQRTSTPKVDRTTHNTQYATHIHTQSGSATCTTRHTQRTSRYCRQESRPKVGRTTINVRNGQCASRNTQRAHQHPKWVVQCAMRNTQTRCKVVAKERFCAPEWCF